MFSPIWHFFTCGSGHTNACRSVPVSPEILSQNGRTDGGKDTGMEAPFTVSPEEAERFSKICHGILMHGKGGSGIGTLSERTMHAAVKCFLSDDPARQEVPVPPYVADVMEEDGHIFEVQTQGFFRLVPKLDLFLQDHDVTVVYPYPLERYTVTLTEQGEIKTPRRKSTRPGRLAAVPEEFYALRSLLSHPRLHLRILLLEVTDYRMPGTPPGRKRRRASTRVERMPCRLLGDFSPAEPKELNAFLPDDLPEVFSAAALAGAAHIPVSVARTVLTLLHSVGGVDRAGKEGRAYLWRKV